MLDAHRFAVVLMAGVCQVVLAACGGDSPVAGSAEGDAIVADSGGDLELDVGQSDSAPSDAAEADLTQPDASDGARSDTAGPDLPTEPPATLDEDRPARVAVPDDWADRSDWPLIVLLHGYSATAALQDFVFQLQSRVDDFGFVLVLPEGTEDLLGNQFWNATDACCDLYGSGVDDVAYLTRLIDEARTALRIDPDRVYLVGHSNGGFMAHRMACDRADRVTAIASLAGVTFLDSANCDPGQPVSVLQIHGTLDTTIQYAGGTIPAAASYPGARATALQWRDHNGCAGDPSEDESRNYETVVVGDETVPEQWEDCEDGVSVDLWTIEGGGHIPTFNNRFRNDLVEHLLAQVRE